MKKRNRNKKTSLINNNNNSKITGIPEALVTQLKFKVPNNN